MWVWGRASARAALSLLLLFHFLFTSAGLKHKLWRHAHHSDGLEAASVTIDDGKAYGRGCGNRTCRQEIAPHLRSFRCIMEMNLTVQ